jgi:hypothetical protein
MARRRVLVVGGKDYNVPTWARRAFEINLVATDERGDLIVPEPESADVIVICVNYIANSVSGQARAIARKWNLPTLKARDGWSSAVAQAAQLKIDWFVDAVQLAGQDLADEDPPQAEAALEVVENAWRNAAHHEREKTEDLEAKLAKVSSDFERLRSGAEQRVLAAIAQQRTQQGLRDPDTEHWAQVEVGLMKEAVEALLLRMQRLEKSLRNGVSSPPNGGDDGLPQSGGRRR